MVVVPQIAKSPPIQENRSPIRPQGDRHTLLNLDSVRRLPGVELSLAETVECDDCSGSIDPLHWRAYAKRGQWSDRDTFELGTNGGRTLIKRTRYERGCKQNDDESPKSRS